MTAAWLIYLASVVGEFKFLSGMATFLGIAASFVLFVGSSSELAGDEVCAARFRRATKLLKISIATAVLASVLPASSTIYLMAGAKVSQDILAAPETKEIGGKILRILNEKLDEQIMKGEK
jgi:hypothetical protein